MEEIYSVYYLRLPESNDWIPKSISTTSISNRKPLLNDQESSVRMLKAESGEMGVVLG